MLAEELPNTEDEGEKIIKSVGADFLWETKYDGARIIAIVGPNQPTRLFGRSGSEKTQLFPELEFDVTQGCILDGEVISGGAGGDFNRIQHRINRSSGVGLAAKAHPAVFKVFDILEVTNIKSGTEFNLRTYSLLKRKTALSHVLKSTETVEQGDYTEDGLGLFTANKVAGGEGVIGKKKSSLYVEDARSWLKVKNWKLARWDVPEERHFMVVGYTQGTGWRESTFGALVLADEDCKHVGEVGTGFDMSDLKAIVSMFSPASCPFPRVPCKATWIKPFPVNIRYLEFTKDGKLRFPSFRRGRY